MAQSKPGPLEGGANMHVIMFDPIFSMSANDDAGSERKRPRPDDNAASFVFAGQENVPDGVIRVRVHPSIKVIRARAFF